MVAFLFFILNSSFAQQVFKTTPTSVIGYYEYLPADYNANTNKYPIVVFLHGLGERCPNTTDIAILGANIVNVAKHGPAKHVKNGTQFPFILISPQLKSNYGDWPTSYVLEVLNYVKTYLRVDERRIYLTGLSLGGGGTWNTTQDNPKLFAAIAPVCGSRNSTSKACPIAAENLPVWAFHGDADDVVALSKSVNMVNAINACTPAPTPRALMTIYPGITHNSWDRAYTTDHTYHNPNVYEWMMSYTNTTNGSNKIPVANAGADINTKSTSATVTGSATDTDGTIASYTWTKMTGPACTITNATTNALKLSGMAEGTFLFRLTVTDNAGDFDSDYVTVTYKKNVLPVANAGSDQSILTPTSSVSLAGTGTDSDGTVSAYEWTLVSGPSSVTFANTASASTTASGLTGIGTYTLKLTVKDNNGASKSDNLNVVVGDSQGRTLPNSIPSINAGADLSISLPTTSVSITGSASDTDGTISSYSWKQISGPVTAALTNMNAAIVTASNLTTTGTYVFELTVKDDKGAINTDRMNVVVGAASSSSARISQPATTETTIESIAIVTDESSWNDKFVTVYNESGTEVYSGKWSDDQYANVFTEQGMYLYRVQHSSTKIKSGKIAIVK